jgi:hypothetical protein
LVAVLSALLPVISRADLMFTVTLNTSGLIAHPAAPFALDFQLVDGSGLGDGNNTVLLTNFNFGVGGAAVGAPVSNGPGATGSLGSALSLHDSVFFSEFTQGFTPGSTLSFNVHTTTNVDAGPTPDQFTFAILDKTPAELPTTDPTGFNTFVTVTLDSANPTVNAYASDSTTPPAGGGAAITTGPVVISNVIRSAGVPLPSGWQGAAICLALLLLLQLGKRMRAVCAA